MRGLFHSGDMYVMAVSYLTLTPISHTIDVIVKLRLIHRGRKVDSTLCLHRTVAR